MAITNPHRNTAVIVVLVLLTCVAVLFGQNKTKVARPASESRPATQAGDKKISLLWFGDSMMPPQLKRFTGQVFEAAGYDVEACNKSGGYFNVGAFVTLGEKMNTHVGNGDTVENFLGILDNCMAKQKYTHVVMCMRWALNIPEIMEHAPKYTKKFCDAVRAKGARPVFYISFDIEGKNGDTVKAMFAKMAVENDALLAFCGDTIATLEKAKGSDYVRNKKVGDHGHVGPYANYAIGCGVFAGITGQSPVGNSMRKIETCNEKVPWGEDITENMGSYTTIVTDEEAKYLQQVAWDVYVKYSKFIASATQPSSK